MALELTRFEITHEHGHVIVDCNTEYTMMLAPEQAVEFATAIIKHARLANVLTQFDSEKGRAAVDKVLRENTQWLKEMADR